MIDFAVIVFVDMRGFTAWATNTEVSAHLEGFVRGFQGLLRAAFPTPKPWFFKGLGDGAMLVRSVAETEAPAAVLEPLVAAIDRVEHDFARYCKDFAIRFGVKADLTLGWGITRGRVHRTTKPADFLGANVNKAARLCDMARPYGIAIDEEDFGALPDQMLRRFGAQTRAAKGIGDIDVLVTAEIARQILPREKLRERPEVHVAGVCIRVTGNAVDLLLARRSNKRSLFPGLLEGCGGQLRLSESFAGGVERHFLTELNVRVKVLTDLYCLYEIRESETPIIPGIRFACLLAGAPPEELTSPHHDEVFWASLQDVEQMAEARFIGGVKAQAVDLAHRYLQARP